MTKKRRLAAIMFTDISGFSAMMQDNEAYAKRILERHREVIVAAHDRFQGKILQYFGDGTLSIFDSAVAAVECAVEIQIDFRREPEVPVRLGIHTGDITYDADGAFGDGVNVASRVENLCLPGAVYLTAKVYDDIKNHAWLRALNLGSFNLRNIQAPMVIYAISSKGLPLPVKQHVVEEEITAPAVIEQPKAGKKKLTAAILALFFGVFGMHRFYLGQRGRGILYAIFFGISMMATIEEGVPLVAVMGIIGFMDAVLLFVMPKPDFDLKYNQNNKALKKAKIAEAKRLAAQTRPQRAKPPVKRPITRRRPKRDPVEALMERGMRKFTTGRYAQALSYFDQVLERDAEHAEAHFRLACCFSMEQKKKDAFFYLSRAVQLGYANVGISNEPTLRFLRSQPEYQNFAQNNYSHPPALPEPKPDLLQSDRFDPLILEKIELLGDRLENGELSRKEFELAKQKILKGE